MFGQSTFHEAERSGRSVPTQSRGPSMSKPLDFEVKWA